MRTTRSCRRSCCSSASWSPCSTCSPTSRSRSSTQGSGMPSPSSGETNLWLASGASAAEPRPALQDTTPAPGAVRRLRRASGGQRFGLVPRIGLTVFGLLLLASLLAPALPLADPLQQTLSLRNAGPSPHHLLGTDLVGRDMLSRMIYGCRSAFAGVALGVLAMLAIGVPWGLAAGFFGAAVDEVLMRVADALLSFPPLILAIGVVSALGPSISHAMVTVGVISAPGVARLLRSAVLPVRNAQFVLIARSLGVTRLHIAACCPTRWLRLSCRPSPRPATSSSWRRRSASSGSACRRRPRRGARTWRAR